MQATGKFVWFSVTVFVNSFIRGYVLSKLWIWFISSQFDVPPLSVAQALGIAIMIAYVTGRFAPEKSTAKTEEEKDAEKENNKQVIKKSLTAESIFKSIVWNAGMGAVILGIAWIYTLFL